MKTGTSSLMDGNDYKQIDQTNLVTRGSTALVKVTAPQTERMYSEEEVYHILVEHTAFLFQGGKSTLTEWFEKYKK